MNSPKCPMCLSQNRKMFGNLDVLWAYRVVLGIPEKNYAPNDTINVICWECRAVLIRLQRFRQKAAIAQSLLLDETAPSLSNLAVSRIHCVAIDESKIFRADLKIEQDSIYSELPPEDIWVDSALCDEMNYSIRNYGTEQDGLEFKVESNTKPIEKIRKNKTQKESENVKTRRSEKLKSERYRRKSLKKCEIARGGEKTTDGYDRNIEKRNDLTIQVPERNTATGTLDCDRCEAKLKSAEYYRVHYRAHVSDKTYQCDICTKSYNTRRMIILHLKKHRPMKFLCEVCGIPNRSRHTLKIHMYSHASLEERRYVCDLCPRKFSMPDKLKIHKLRHTGVKSYKCDLCDYSFYVKFELTKHLQTHHGIVINQKRTQSQRTKSAVMNKPFSSVAQPNIRKYNTKEKSAAHSGVTNCEFCGKKFANNIALKSHIFVHTGDRPYRCNICGKSFKFHSNVVTHNLSVHEAKKSHECSICNAKFKLKGNLTVHMKTHTGEKPYSCDVCSQGFIRRRNLNSHYRVHTKT